MKIEWIYDGTRELFLEFVKTFQKERTSEGNNDPFYWIVNDKVIHAKSREMVLLWDSRGNHKTLAFIHIQNIQNGKSRLIVHIPDTKKDKLVKWWILLRDEIERQKGLAFGSEKKPQKRGKMREWREKRALLFKDIKDKNPSLSYKKVADEATDQARNNIISEIKELHPTWDDRKIEAVVDQKFQEDWKNYKGMFSADDVENDYKSMGWVWVNSRTIRLN